MVKSKKKSSGKRDPYDLSYVPVQELLTKVDDIYKLVILASRRAVELNHGSGKLIDITSKAKLSTIALAEIREGKVSYKVSDEKGTSTV